MLLAGVHRRQPGAAGLGSSQAIARFQDVCLDASNPARTGAFRAAGPGRAWQAKANGNGLLTGPTPQHTIWVNRVPEAKTVKHRVHLDIYARIWRSLEALGATILERQHGTRTWTVMPIPRAASPARSAMAAPGSSPAWSARPPKASVEVAKSIMNG